MDKLPLCLKPTSDAEKDYFIDLIQRSLYYHALDDRYLEQKLSDIKESDQTLQAFHHESIRAEAQREHYQSVTATSNVLDSSNSVSVNKFENSTANKKWQHSRGRGGAGGGVRGRGRGCYQLQPQSSVENTLQHSDAKGYIGEKFQQQNSNRYKKKYPPKCFNCNELGHMAFNCNKQKVKKCSTENITDKVSKMDVSDTPYENDFNCFKVDIEEASSISNGTTQSQKLDRNKMATIAGCNTQMLSNTKATGIGY